MIRKLASGEYRLYSRKKNPKTGKRRNLGTFKSLEAAQKHERKHHARTADHRAEGKKRDRDRRTLIDREVLQTLHLAIDVVRQDQASEQGNFDAELVELGLFIRDCEERQRNAVAGFPPGFNCGKL